jgi:enoyl-CoA hydratase/carnithine racemase
MAKVTCEVAGAVRRVLLNRPEKRNALDAEMIAAVKGAFTAPPGAGERVAVIRAEGAVFCAGLDLKERAANPGEVSPIEDMLHAIETFPLPVVAVVAGDAIAGGNELAMHCDLVIASTAARFGMSLAQIGMAPSWFLGKKLLELAGPATTRRILLLGDPLPAQRLYDLGVISHIAEPEDLESVAGHVIERLASNAPLSLKAMKALIVRQMAFRDAIAHTDIDTLVATVRRSEDAQEGMAARLARRRPQFKGR